MASGISVGIVVVMKIGAVVSGGLVMKEVGLSLTKVAVADKVGKATRSGEFSVPAEATEPQAVKAKMNQKNRSSL